MDNRHQFDWLKKPVGTELPRPPVPDQEKLEGHNPEQVGCE